MTCEAPVQTFVEAPGPLGPLKGTMLAAPSGPAPTGLIIPGSGPTDRDGNGNVGLRAQTYRFLAEGLAANSITTIRIDKRGMYGSATAVKDGNAVTIADYAADVHTWADYAGAPIWLLGHSEGGLVALVAAQKRGGVRGLILIAAPGRRLGDIMREQLGVHPQVLAHAEPVLAALEQGRHVDLADMSEDMRSLFRPEVQGFLIEALSYDPAKLIAALDMPVLILQGGRDLQVNAKDAELLKTAAPNAELAFVPHANHVLKSVMSDNLQDNVATYSDPSLPLADGVVATITDFIRRHGG
jgi:pimeloyl-ACP methyl ester carboxylesterase